MAEDSLAPTTAASKRRGLRDLSVCSSLDPEPNTCRQRLGMPMMYQMYESQYDDLRGTVYGPESPDFYPVQASEILRKALQGMDTKDADIIRVVLNHNNYQRQKIVAAYEDMYSRNLMDDLEEEMGGYFLEMAVALFKPAHSYDTKNLHKSITNRYGDRSVAIELSCTRSSRQLTVIRETYLKDYKKQLEKDIAVKVEGIVGKLLTLLLTKPRQEETGRKIDEALVAEHAKTLHSNPIDEWVKNAQIFEQIFTGHAWKHIAAVFDKLDELRGEDREIETAIRKSKSVHSEVRIILLTILRVSRNMQLYFAEKLHAAMTGDKPDHSTIIRICVTRSEIDLYDIAEEYKRKYRRTLEMDIQATCSGDYARIVTALSVAS